jgi:hypothetical protein
LILLKNSFDFLVYHIILDDNCAGGCDATAGAGVPVPGGRLLGGLHTGQPFIVLLYIFRKLYPKHIDEDDLQGLINIREALLALSVRL